VEQVPHLSVSQIEDYIHCGERWRLKKVEKIHEPNTSTQIRGKVVHAATAENMRAKRDKGKELGVEEVESLAFDGAKAAFEGQSVLLTEEEAEEGLSAVKMATADVAMWLARLHHQEVAPYINPVCIEEKIRVTMEGIPPLEAVLDLTDTSDRIHDTKTKTRKPKQDEARISLQLTQYHLSFEAKNGRPPQELVLDHLIYYRPSGSRPMGAVEFMPQETTRSQAAMDAYLERVVAVDRAMKAGIAVPADVNSWKCSPKYCGFFGDICKYTRGSAKIGGSV